MCTYSYSYKDVHTNSAQEGNLILRLSLLHSNKFWVMHCKDFRSNKLRFSHANKLPFMRKNIINFCVDDIRGSISSIYWENVPNLGVGGEGGGGGVFQSHSFYCGVV